MYRQLPVTLKYIPLISMMYSSIFAHKCASSTLLVVGEVSRQENGSEGGDGEEGLGKVEEKTCSYVPKGTPGCIFKLANNQLIFKEEIKARSAEDVLWK